MKNGISFCLKLSITVSILLIHIIADAQVKLPAFSACHDCVYEVSDALIFDDGGENGTVSNLPQTTTYRVKKGSGKQLSLFFSEIDIPEGSKLVVYYKNFGDETSSSAVFNALRKTANIVADEITVEYLPVANSRGAKGWEGVIREVDMPVKSLARIASQPESDCPFAIPLCSNNTVVALAGQYTDLGQINDDSGSCYSGTGSGGSVWYSFTPLSNGPLDFTISPQGTTDYDFVLWDITNGCGNGQRIELACNYSLYTGETGMSGTRCNENLGNCSGNNCTNQSKAADCNRFNGRVNVSSDKKYALSINFYSGSNDGFVLTFQKEPGSVAITDNTPPTVINAYANNCTSATTLRIFFSEWVDCSTIQNSDFRLQGYTFSVISTNCTGNKTNFVDVAVSPALGPGTHVINVRDILDLCGNNMNSNYNVILGTPPNPAITNPVPVCKNPEILGFSYSPSSQNLTASGGTSYQWSTGQNTATISVSPTSTRTYTVRVFNNACVDSISTTVIVRQAEADLGPDKYFCGTPVTLTATPTGSGYTYQFYRAPNILSNGTLIQEGASNTVSVSPTATTTYRVVITDPNGCKARDDVRVIVSTSTNATIDIPGNNFCVNANPVVMTAVPEGGTFTGPGVSGNIFNPSVAGVGTHTINYSTTNECGTYTGTKTVSVTTGSLPSLNLASVYCVTDADVSIAPSPSCGTFSGPGITTSGLCILNNYILQPNFSPSQAGAGTHIITYTPPAGSNFCANSTTVTVIGTGFEPQISGAASTYCSNSNPVTLTGTPSGGVFSGPGISGNVFNPATAGVGIHTINYTVVQCSNTFSTSIQIEVKSSSPSATISYSGSPYCATTSTAQSVTFSGTPGGAYSATPSGLAINSSTGSIIPSQSSQGTYTVTYTIPAGDGCPSFTQTTTVTITSSIPPLFNLPEEICSGSTPPQLPSTSNNSINGTWNPATVSNTTPGTYTFTPAQGQCSGPASFIINVLPAPTVNAGASETLVEPGTEVQLFATPVDEEAFYSWTPAILVEDPNNPSTSAVVEESTWFYVTATYGESCSSIDSVFIQVRQSDICEGLNIFLPNAFSPNGDGQNGEYRVRSVVPLERMLLAIYNRWGEKVFETRDQTIYWDGSYKGKPAPADSYGYYFEAECDGNLIKKQGNITLIR